MSLKDPRADSLPLIRDFITTINEGVIRRLSDFKLVVPNWKRARCYHYWSAIRDLKFAELEDQTIRLTRLGKQLAQVAEFNRFQTPGRLNSEERRIFKLAFLQYERIKEFLSYFISNGKTFESYDQLEKYGDVVIIKPNPENKKSIIVITAVGEKVPLSQTQTKTVKWSFKLWCKELGIIDEIWLEEDRSYSKYLNTHNIPKRIFFPIKLDIEDAELTEFQRILDAVTQRIGSHHISIPILTYYFCTTYFVLVKSFHSKLIDLYRLDPYHYYLETGSIVGANESFRGIRNYDNYLRVDGYLRGYLVVRK